eukprot:scaffold34921_cov236-Isochrysis_galbana.AAC.6
MTAKTFPREPQEIEMHQPDPLSSRVDRLLQGSPRQLTQGDVSQPVYPGARHAAPRLSRAWVA